jgi:hypothetical protein
MVEIEETRLTLDLCDSARRDPSHEPRVTAADLLDEERRPFEDTPSILDPDPHRARLARDTERVASTGCPRRSSPISADDRPRDARRTLAPRARDEQALEALDADSELARRPAARCGRSQRPASTG